MRTYTITEYDKQDYDDYEKNITLAEIINNLERVKRGYVGDYNFTGEVDDFYRFKLHVSLNKAIDMFTKMDEKENSK